MGRSPILLLSACHHALAECSGGTCGEEKREMQRDAHAEERSRRSEEIQFYATIIALILAFIILAYAIRWVWLQNKTKAEAREARQASRDYDYVVERIKTAENSLLEPLFPMVLISFDRLLNYGRLPTWEEARDAADLIFLDTYEKIGTFIWCEQENTVVFISHQWLGWTEPDNEKVHYRAICTAAEELLRKDDLPTSNPARLFIWLDYCCVPQTNPHLQKMAIQSLAVYASSVVAFVVIAPTCTHTDSGKTCNTETYLSRGWCRLEQWARISIGATENFFLFDGVSTRDGSMLVPIASDEKWLHDSVDVMGGSFTNDADRFALVDSVLSLWSITLDLHRAHAEDKSHFSHRIHQLISERKQVIFPEEYFGNMIEVLEQRKGTASGEDVDRLLEGVAARKGVKNRLKGSLARSVTRGSKGVATVIRRGSKEMFLRSLSIPSISSMSSPNGPKFGPFGRQKSTASTAPGASPLPSSTLSTATPRNPLAEVNLQVDREEDLEAELEAAVDAALEAGLDFAVTAPATAAEAAEEDSMFVDVAFAPIPPIPSIPSNSSIPSIPGPKSRIASSTASTVPTISSISYIGTDESEFTAAGKDGEAVLEAELEADIEAGLEVTSPAAVADAAKEENVIVDEVDFEIIPHHPLQMRI